MEAQGEAPKPNRDVETRMDVHVNAYLPAEYVTGDKQRLEVYKRIASITTAAQRDDVEEELVDRFGDEPLCVANLVAVAYLKAMCAKLGIDRVNQADGRIDMRFAANAQVDGQKLFKALTGFDKRLTLNAAPPVTLTLKDTTLNREDLLMLCVKVMERLLARRNWKTTEPAHMQRRKKFRKKRHFCRTMDLKIPIPHLEPAFPELRDPQSFLLSVSVHAMHSASLKRKSHKLHGTGEK